MAVVKTPGFNFDCRRLTAHALRSEFNVWNIADDARTFMLILSAFSVDPRKTTVDTLRFRVEIQKTIVDAPGFKSDARNTVADVRCGLGLRASRLATPRTFNRDSRLLSREFGVEHRIWSGSALIKILT